MLEERPNDGAPNADAPNADAPIVAPGDRRLRGRDLAVLWTDLSVGLLVMVTGALLVPSLGLARATLAIAIGSVLGSALLAIVGRIGQVEGAASMALLRPTLGTRGSAVPSLLNLLQLVGWTSVEFWAMASVADAASRAAFGWSDRGLWLVAVAVACTALAVAGPVTVVRRWLERVGGPVLLLAAAWITARVLTAGDLGALWATPGSGGMPFWLAVDLVAVMPISWLPLVADYTRLARTDARAFAGTFVGSTVGTAWCYLLGVLLVLVAGATPDLGGIGGAIVAVAGGGVLIVALLVGETDNAFANLYSAGMSARNVRPGWSQRATVIAVAAIATALASAFTLERYEVFLLLIGSVFVPLAGAFLGDRVAARGRRDGSPPPAWRPVALLPWAAGFVLYHWSVPTGPQAWVDAVGGVAAAIGVPFPLLGSALGASIPSFALAFVLALVPSLVTRRGRTARSG